MSSVDQQRQAHMQGKKKAEVDLPALNMQRAQSAGNPGGPGTSSPQTPQTVASSSVVPQDNRVSTFLVFKSSKADVFIVASLSGQQSVYLGLV